MRDDRVAVTMSYNHQPSVQLAFDLKPAELARLGSTTGIQKELNNLEKAPGFSWKAPAYTQMLGDVLNNIQQQINSPPPFGFGSGFSPW